MDIEDQVVCLGCQIPLKGKTDKKFCDDNCRTNYNNRKRQSAASQAPDFLKKNPRIILNNYSILKKLNLSPPTKIKKTLLENQGFNFNFITSYYTTKAGDIYQFCFDQGYLLLKEDMVLLVVQQSQIIT